MKLPGGCPLALGSSRAEALWLHSHFCFKVPHALLSHHPFTHWSHPIHVLPRAIGSTLFFKSWALYFMLLALSIKPQLIKTNPRKHFSLLDALARIGLPFWPLLEGF